ELAPIGSGLLTTVTGRPGSGCANELIYSQTLRMVVAGGLAAEKAELEIVLASGIFERPPAPAQILTYVCGKYFQGAAGEIKEYNIAVEALGRPPDFDQKRDAIVRVQCHRLRERLAEYYEAEGAGHAVHIEIPQGQYAPKFVRREPAGKPAAATE